MVMTPLSPPTSRQRQEEERRRPLHAAQVVPVTTVKDSNVTLYTVGDDRHFFVQHAAAVNLGSGALALTMHLVPDGGSADATNTIYSSLSIASGVTERLDELIGSMLDAGTAIVAVTDDATDGANLWLWGEAIRGGDPSR